MSGTTTSLNAGGSLLTFSAPVLVSGTARNLGAVYKYSNVITIGGTQVDATVTISGLDNATVTNFDNDSAVGTGIQGQPLFAPQITTATANGGVTFDFTFQTSLGGAVRLENFYNNSIDIDGPEYVEYGGFASFEFASATDLVVGPGGGTNLRFEQDASQVNYNGLEVNEPGRVQTYFDGVSGLQIKMGASAAATNRQYGSAFSFIAFSNPTTFEAPTVDPIATPSSSPDLSGSVGGAFTNGDILTVTINGNNYTTGNGDVLINGTSWTLPGATLGGLPEGTYSVEVTHTYAAANNLAITDQTTNEVVIDSTPPVAPTIGIVAADDVINAAEQSNGVTLSGTTEAGSTVTLSIGGQTRTATTNGASWSYALTAGDFLAMGEGTETLTVSAADAAANVSLNGTRPITVDTVIPGAPGLALSADTGTSGADGVTSDGTVTVSGLEPGAAWEYSTNGGTSWATGTGGSFVLPAGSYAASQVRARQTDTAGNLSAAGALGAVTVDATPPVAPTIGIVAADDVISAAEQSNGVTLSGTTEAGSTVTLSIGGQARAATANGASWSYALIPADFLNMGEGAETITAVATDAAGNVSLSNATRSITIDTGAPGQPAIALASDTGASGSDGVTSDGTVTASGLEPGAAWEYSTNGGASWATGTGGSFVLPAGSYAASQVQARQTDTAGNLSTAAALGAVTVDASVAAPGLALSTDTGANGADGVTSDGTVTVSGLEPDAAWEYSTNGGTSWVVGTGGSFVLPAGSYAASQVRARQTDTAGNLSAAAALGAVTVDATPPGQPAITSPSLNNDATPELTGTAEAGSTVTVNVGGATYSTVATGGGWSIDLGTASPVSGALLLDANGINPLTASATDIAGNTSNAASQNLVIDTTAPAGPAIDVVAADDVINVAERTAGVVITGSTEAGSTVVLSFGGVSRAATTSGTNWSYALTGTDLLGMGEGAETLTASATDAAGNTGPGGTRTITVDTGGPGLPAALTLALASDTGAPDDRATSDTTPSVTGTAEPGSLVTLYDTDGTTVLGTATAGPGADWSITTVALGEGNHALTARATDGAGNTSGPSSPLVVSIDSIAPGQPTALGLASGSDTGRIGDNHTTRTAPTVTGAAEAGSLVTLYDSDGVTVLGTGTADPDGIWSITSATLSYGDHSLTARATDAVGNLSNSSAALLVTTAEFDLPPIFVTATYFSGQVTAGLYSGPVSYIVYEFLGTSEGEAVVSTALSDFLSLGSGDDAADGGTGDDVLDGGTGSNFLTGGAGQDVFFIDGRNGETTWSTITDWSGDEQLSLWGWRPGVSRVSWVDQAGAEGYQGVTMHGDLDGNDVIDTSVTWTGLTRADLPEPVEQDGLLWFT